ncbi:MAG TPA: DUF5676 family membrane protein [Pseudomonadales bacterium]|nr:DUF5676 family membrane protein [Pseudomonadales bacterium]
MKLDPLGLAAASAIAIAIVWTLCSILVALMPMQMSTMTGHMIHAQFEMAWVMSWAGYLIGLIVWSAWAALTGCLIAIAYNRIVIG